MVSAALASWRRIAENSSRLTPDKSRPKEPVNGRDFARMVDRGICPFLSELGFELEAPSISWRMYRARFDSKTHSIDLSFEPGDRTLFVIVLTRENGELSNIDDSNQDAKAGKEFT